MAITVEQCRAARALLDWSIDDLAKAASVGVMTVNRFEGRQPVSAASISKITAALTAARVIFVAEGERSDTGGAGVRLARVEP